MYKGGVVHSGEVHTAPDHDHGEVPDYTCEQLQHFHSKYTCCHEVDDPLEHIRDKSLIAEVARFQGTMDTMDHLHKEIREREETLYCQGNDNRKCVHHLELAHTLGRVFEEEEIANGLRIITPWVVERRREERGHSS
jgi:hypothetical protein